MEKKIKTTVVIPNYNGKKYLQDCLTFLKRNKGTDFDVIVVDDGSDDGSCEMVKDRFGFVKLIALEENGGFAKAVNTGIRAAETEFVLLLNNDTVPEPDFVAEMEKSIEGGGRRCFSASAKMLSMKEPDKIDGCGDLYCAFGWAFSAGKGQSGERFTRKSEVFSSCAGAAIYKRDVLLKLGLFDELHFAYLEDVDVGYRARLFGYRNIYCPKAVVYHAGSASSGSRHNAFKVRLASRNSVYLIFKNMPALQILLNLPFLLAGFLIKGAFFTLKGFGGIYFRGLAKGVAMSFSPEGREHRVRFKMSRFGNYVRVQLMLWRNILALSIKIR